MSKAISKHTAEHYLWGNQCSGWTLNNSASLSVKQELMPPGTKEHWHYHQYTNQFFYILKGNAVFYKEGERIQLNKEEGLYVECGQKHYISNEGVADIEFLVISQREGTAKPEEEKSQIDRINL